MKCLRFKPDLRASLEAANKADRFYAAMSGREPQNQSVIAPKRERAAPRDLEGPVVAAISELLTVHPRVIWAARFNSGMASYEAKTGAYAPVWFHKFLRQPQKMRMPDFFGIMSCGLPFAIEAKAPGWTKPKDDREREQMAFLNMVAILGGTALFATSVDDVAEALK